MVIIISIMANPALLSSHFTRQLYEFARLLKTTNSCLNPILYTLLIRGFRKDLKRLCCRKSKSDTNSSLKKSSRSSPRAEDRQALSPAYGKFHGTVTVKLENGYDFEREDDV